MQKLPEKLGDFPDFYDLQARGFAGVKCDKPGLMIAITARTGSSHLCAALEAAGDMGRPSDIFNPRGVLQMEVQNCRVDTFAAYIDSFNREPGRYFAFKTAWQDFDPVADGFRALFPNLDVVYLDRDHKVEQAVSLFRAQESGVWHQPAIGPMEVPKSVEFNLRRIEDILDELVAEKALWTAFFTAKHIKPMKLSYETIAQDVRAAVAEIAKQTGMELGRPIGPRVGYVKLADKVSKAWVEQVLKQHLQLT
jgi:LPS sulfotransferase NodH